MLAASALAYLLLATILVMAVYSLERTARRTIARLLLESGVELDGEMTLAHMRANISSIVASLDEARQKERSLATEAAIGRMAQLLAHDVRKPITLVRAGVAALARQSDPAQVLQKAGALADRMETVTRSVEGLIEDVLEAGRPTRIAAEPASVRALVETALAELAIVAPGPALRTTVTFGHHNKGVFDTAKVGRVLTNIIDNAVAAAGAAGRIWIRTEECEPAGALRIIVGNSGSFIAEQDRLKVFDSFYTSGKRNGTGLGLAIARKIIEAHGGRIWCVSSESPGDAPETEFVFELPPKSGSPDEAPIQSRITAQSPVAATPGPKDAVAVVVLDDDPFVREDWASHLEDVAVAEFARPEDFLAALDQTPDKFVGVKAVVTDYYFDQTSALTGIDLAARLAGKLVGAAILLASDVVRDGLDLPPGVQAIPKTPLRAPELWRRIGYA
jgi:signal transduction histidine kinase